MNMACFVPGACDGMNFGMIGNALLALLVFLVAVTLLLVLSRKWKERKENGRFVGIPGKVEERP